MRYRWWIAGGMALVVAIVVVGCGGGSTEFPAASTDPSAAGGTGAGAASPDVSTAAVAGITVGNMVVFGFNELGMHCMNKDFSKTMILPPFNTVRALVIKRGEDPEIVRRNVTVSYSIPGNTRSSTKTNFWTYAGKLLGLTLAPDTGLTGTRLAGNMVPKGDGRYEATGIPITPIMDNGTLNAYPLANIVVKSGATVQASTKAVVPVSWEISCNLCHSGREGTDMNILNAHDRMHGTSLAKSTPVACGKCHQQPPLAGVLGPGKAGVPSLSRAMHGTHATRLASAGMANNCYACHPGQQTQCQRDVHKAKGMGCTDCHGSMTSVAAPTRRPWEDEPKCGTCHHVAGHEYEEPGKLFRESRGHNGVYCTACHNTPHAISPSTVAADNVQAIGLQGKAGTINKCSVCHVQTPDDRFNHTLDD